MKIPSIFNIFKCNSFFSKLNIVTKNELYRYFTSPLAYVYLISFLILNGSCAFYFGDFFGRGIANLDSMFAFQPWLYLLFIPGISMRLWSEEFRNKTIIQIITMPIPVGTLIWGKFLAAWAFSGIALVLTFPFWISINILGDPDNSMIFIGYLASFLTAGAILSISAMMSALTKNQVIALVLSVFANLLFFLSGLEFVLSIFRKFMPISIIDMIASFSFLTHFNVMTKGLIELRDIFFFSSIIILFNLFTILIISFKTSGTSKLFKSNNKTYYVYIFIFVLLGFVGINLTANNLLRNIRFDFTQEKLFTLSSSTYTILEKLPEDVTIKLYYTPELGERNPEVKLTFDRVRLLLDKYKSISKNKISYKIYNPKFLDNYEDEAISNGIISIPLIDVNKNAYFGMTISDSLDNKSTIPFFNIERQDFIEQDITQKIYELHHKKKTVGILAGLNIFDYSISDSSTGQKWRIIDKISELYNVVPVSTPEEIDSLDILMIVHPKDLKEDMISKIKEFSTSGGKIFINMDAAPESIRLYSTVSKYIPSSAPELTDFWGFKFYNEYVIADLDNSITVDATKNYNTNVKFTQDIIQIKLHGDSLNKSLLETANLQSILMTSASPIRATSEDIYFIPLISASENSAIMPISVVYDNLDPDYLLKYFEKDPFEKYIAARIISKDVEKPFDIIAVGDVDYLYDNFWGEVRNFLDKEYVIQILDNANFVMNALDILSGDTDLVDLRGKSAKIRKFNDVEKLRRDSQKSFTNKEFDILDKINETKSNLQEIIEKRTFEGRENFNPDELAIVASIRKDIDRLRLELSEIRENAHNDVKLVQYKYQLINVYLIPAIICLIIAVIWFLTRQKSNIKSQKLEINKSFIILTILSLTILAIGFTSVYYVNQSSIDRYEDKPAFPDLVNKVNDINNISLKTNKNTLSFYKEDNFWKLKGYENQTVFQERISSFLSALIQAGIHEKKSNKAEDLRLFGLEPIETNGSKNTRVELYNNQKEVLSFEIGKYDIDLGRGKKAAYMKYDKKFQTWLIDIDLIDLSNNWQDWSYSTLWNLRFGRLQSINGNKDATYVSNIMKDILNVHITNETIKKSSSKERSHLNLLNEDNDLITINIYKEKEDFFIGYKFSDKIKNKHLDLFAKTAKGKIFKLDKKDYDKIKNIK